MKITIFDPIGQRKMTHAIGCAMITMLALVATFLILGVTNGSIATLVGALAAIGWEVWNSVQHLFGKPKNKFDIVGVAYGMFGTAFIVAIHGAVELIQLFMK